MKKNPTKTFNNDYVLLEKNNQKKNWILKTVSWVLLNLRYDLTLTRNLYEKQVLLFYIRGNLKLFSFTALFKKKNYHPKDCVKNWHVYTGVPTQARCCHNGGLGVLLPYAPFSASASLCLLFWFLEIIFNSVSKAWINSPCEKLKHYREAWSSLYHYPSPSSPLPSRKQKISVTFQTISMHLTAFLPTHRNDILFSLFFHDQITLCALEKQPFRTHISPSFTFFFFFWIYWSHVLLSSVNY